jgi:hypothetical protein
MEGTFEHDKWMERILGAVRSLRMANQLNAEQVRERRPVSSHTESGMVAGDGDPARVG